MKTNTLLKWLVLPVSTLVLVGCGGSSTPTNVVSTAEAFYVDSAVSGLDYSCGSQTGVTGPNGEFTFEVGEGCSLFLDKIKLRDIAADQLENGKEIQETNVDIARVLLSLDSDRNPDNGITIDSDILGSMVDAGVSTLTDILNEWSAIVPPEWTTFTDLVSETVAKAHLMQSILQEHTLYTNISGQVNTLESWTFNADLTSVAVVEIEGGNENITLALSFNEGTLTLTSSTGDVVEITTITNDYIAIMINGDPTRLYYDEAKARAYFFN